MINKKKSHVVPNSHNPFPQGREKCHVCVMVTGMKDADTCTETYIPQICAGNKYTPLILQISKHTHTQTFTLTREEVILIGMVAHAE